MELPADRRIVRKPVQQAHLREQSRRTRDPEPAEFFKAPNEIEGGKPMGWPPRAIFEGPF